MCISPEDAEKVYSSAKENRFKLGLSTANDVFKGRLKLNKNYAHWYFDFQFNDIIDRIALKYKEKGWHVRLEHNNDACGMHKSLHISTIPFKKYIFKKVKDY